MNIYLFTLLAFGTVFFARWAQASSLPRAHAAKTFLSVFLERVADLLLCVAVVSLFLSAVLGVLQIYYWNGINIGSLLAIENAKNWVWGLLDTLLPAPWFLAVLAFALAIALAVAASQFGRLGRDGVTASAGFFVGAQRWIGRLSVVSAFLATFTFLTSHGTPVTNFIDLRLQEARDHASAIDAAADDFAVQTAAQHLLYAAINSLDPETAAAFDDAQMALGALARHVSLQGNRIPSAQRNAATAFLNENFRTAAQQALPRDPAFRVSQQSPEVALRDFRHITSEDLRIRRVMVDEVQRHRYSVLTNPVIHGEVRSVFYENATKALINRGFRPTTGTGNPLADLLFEVVIDTTVERARESLGSRAQKIRAAIVSFAGNTSRGLVAVIESAVRGMGLSVGDPQSRQPTNRTDLRALSLKARSLQEDAKPTRAETSNSGQSRRDGKPRATQPGPRQRSGEIFDGGRCPPGQVLLKCGNFGAEFCGSPGMAGMPCR